MAPFELSVSTISQAQHHELGAEFSQYAVIVSWARRNGLLAQLEEQLKLARNKGYQGIDIFLVLLGYFSSQTRWRGLRGFAEDTRGVGEQLAAVGGRRSWPTQAAISRTLASVEIDQARTFGAVMLREALDLRPILHHDSVVDFDCLGQAWHVFDFDPTHTALRRRALPEGDDLPEPKRLSNEIAAAGHMGRKRGESKLSRPTLLHRGSRLWFGVDVQPGNADWPEAVKSAFGAVSSVAQNQGLDAERCILCIDGEAGGWPQLQVGVGGPVHFVTRLADYDALKEPGCIEVLERCDWKRVADADSGPARFACEWGTTRVGRRRARLVVSRFQNPGGKAGAGVVRDGWQYEVFATELGQDAFEAADLVTLYYARAGQENYFAIEDRELDLDHIFSIEPGGQLLACITALWLWNVQILLGWLVHPEVPKRADLPQNRPQPEPPKPSPALEPDPPPVTAASTQDNYQLDAYHAWWAARLGARVGWSWDDQIGCPVCPAGQHLSVHGVRHIDSEHAEVRFRGSKTICGPCPMRSQCTSSTRSDFSKELSFSVSPEHLIDDPKLGSQAPMLAPEPRWQPPDNTCVPTGLWEPRPAVLKPQELRHQFRRLCRQSRVEVHLERAPLPAPRSTLMVIDRADRQRTRKPWAHRMAWNAVNPDDKISVTILASPDLKPLLQTNPPPVTAAQPG